MLDEKDSRGEEQLGRNFGYLKFSTTGDASIYTIAAQHNA